jgi:hypothetical protein
MKYIDGYEPIRTNIRIEYESTPIRHLAIQCHMCKKWFVGGDIAVEAPRYSYELLDMKCICPACNTKFTMCNFDEEDWMGTSVYDGVYRKKVEWSQNE